jgi:hypothetical protein
MQMYSSHLSVLFWLTRKMPTASVTVLAVAAVSLVAVTLIMKLPTDSELQQLCPLALHDQIRLVDHVTGSSHS